MADLSRFVVVCNDGAVSEEQLRILQTLKPDMAGVVTCKDGAPLEAVCKEVRGFPAFCDLDTNRCVVGLRRDEEVLRRLSADVAAHSNQTESSMPSATSTTCTS